MQRKQIAMRFFIRETMISAGTQTELSTLPCETLAYASDLVSLVQAGVHNALLNLQHDVYSYGTRVDDMLDVDNRTLGDEFDLCNIDNSHEAEMSTFVACGMEHIDEHLSACAESFLPVRF